ncbi:MAG: M20/M25/M40 family metallo-hydrolase [Dehalobacterium sp.]
MMLSDKDRELYKKCQEAEKEFIEDWKTIVNIDSPTGYGEGLTRVGNFLIDKLESIGAKTEIYPVANKDEGFNVVGSIEGSGKGCILLLAHMDTVLPVGSAAQRPFRIDNNGKAYGPGVSDDKSGIVQCLHSLKILQETGFNNYSKITFMANCQEENGSHSSRKIIMKLAKEHDYIFCAETGVPGDGICVNRAGSGNLITEVKGRTSHAAYPWLGLNAADELAYQSLRLNQLANKEKGTVVTTRIIESGIANREKSVVPDYAIGIKRVYAYSQDELNRVETTAAEFAKDTLIPGTEVKTKLDLAFPPFVKSEKTMKIANLAQEIYADLGLNLKFESGAAATDAGWASNVNTATICSLGPVSGGKNHTAEEWADAKTVVPRLYLMVKMLIELGSCGLK